ncbi:Flagellar biosynthetic protein FliR [Candidatus Magnetomoraceae bacterium gMMP-15]
MDILSLSIDTFKSFILVLLRVSIILFMFPIFGAERIPTVVKAGLSMVTAIVLLPVVLPDPQLFPEDVWNGAYLVISELILAVILRLSIDLFFASIQMAGQLVGFQMGFAIATVFDPNSGVQSSLISQIGYWAALMAFLLLNGHHLVLIALKDSFSIIKLGTFSLQNNLFHIIMNEAANLFVMAIKLGAPAIAALIFVDVAFGLIAKVSPQMNILIVALPLKIGVGLFFFCICLNLILYFTKHYLSIFLPMMRNIMNLMS